MVGEKRERKRQEKAFKGGYSYAAGLLLIQISGCVTKLWMKVGRAAGYGCYTEFDSGIEDAINDACKLGIIDETMTD